MMESTHRSNDNNMKITFNNKSSGSNTPSKQELEELQNKYIQSRREKLKTRARFLQREHDYNECSMPGCPIKYRHEGPFCTKHENTRTIKIKD